VATSNSDVNRREALRRLAAGAVGAATSPMWGETLIALAREHAHTQAASAAVSAAEWTPKVLTPHQNETVVTLTELIIPQTDTPGAKATNVNRFIDWVLSEAPPAERDRFVAGLTWIDDQSRSRYQKDFVAASAEQQTALLTPLADEASQAAKDGSGGTTFFQTIKSMTISGYYSTQVGLQQELGDDGIMVWAVFKGCDHPEHQ
jgi:glucoside 3-dehydrogenase (cytochrome c) hitch-hiker subunit